MVAALPRLQVQQCAVQVLRALGEHQRKLEKQRTPEARHLDRCSLGSVEAKLASVQQQVSAGMEGSMPGLQGCMGWPALGRFGWLGGVAHLSLLDFSSLPPNVA